MAGRSGLGVVPEDRWSSQEFATGEAPVAGRSITRHAGVLDDVWSFDAARFSISPREARQMDPQQRILLEVVSQSMGNLFQN